MRKLFLSALLFIPVLVSAQNTKPFKVNVAAGYAITGDYSNSNAIRKGGFLYSIEPQYRILPNLDLGFRYEQVFMQRPEFIDEATVFQTNTKSILSGLITATYTLNLSGTLKPYLGIGAGLYHASPSEQRNSLFGITTAYPLPATNVIGGVARVGVKKGRGSLELAYNLVNDTRVTVTATNRTLMAKNSYISAKIGFTIGGGSE